MLGTHIVLAEVGATKVIGSSGTEAGTKAALALRLEPVRNWLLRLLNTQPATYRFIYSNVHICNTMQPMTEVWHIYGCIMVFILAIARKQQTDQFEQNMNGFSAEHCTQALIHHVVKSLHIPNSTKIIQNGVLLTSASFLIKCRTRSLSVSGS